MALKRQSSVKVLSFILLVFLLQYSSPLFATDGPGKAISLNGTDFFRTSLWSNELFPTESFTFELWFNALAPGVLVNEADTADVSVWDYSFAEVFPNGVIKVGLPNLPTLIVGTISFGSWHHLAISYNSANTTLSAYLDGQLTGSSQGDRTAPAETGRTTVYAFGRGGPSNLGGGNFFVGQMDEVRIWDRALNSSEINAWFNRSVTSPFPGLAANWHFDSATGNLSPDSSGRTNPALYVPVESTPHLEESFVPLVFTAHTVETLPAVSITNSEVELHGLADSNGSAISVHFQWGPSETFGFTTVTQSLPALSGEQPFSATLTNIPVGDYHFRAVATIPGLAPILGEISTFSVTSTAGKAASLSGTNFFRTSLWSPDLFSDESFTFELWFKPSSPGVLINEADTANTSLWDIAFAEIFPDGIIKAGAPGVPTFIVGTIEFGTWHHLAITYDDSTDSMSAYLDGSLVGSSVGDRIHPSENGRSAVYPFGRGGATNLGGGNWYTGELDEIRIWRRALPPDEIASVYDRILQNEQSGLYANWHMDTALDATSPDASGKNNSALFVPEISPVPLVSSGAILHYDLRPSIIAQSLRELHPFAVELEGVVNPNNLSTFVFFRLGDSNRFVQTPWQNIGLANVPVRFKVNVEGLDPQIKYQYQVFATNSSGVVSGPLVSLPKLGEGRALEFASPQSSIRTRTDLVGFFPDETITIELWFNASKAGVLAGEFDPQDSFIFDRSILEILPSGSIEAGFLGVPPTPVGRAEFGEWNHIALRYNKQALLMDGFLNGGKTVSVSGDRVSALETNRPTFFAFGKAARTKLGTGEAFGGRMDEIRVWNTARSDSDIQKNRFRFVPASEEGLVLYWQFENSTSMIVPDSSLNNNSGQFAGIISLSDAPITFGLNPITFLSEDVVRLQYYGLAGSTYRLDESEDLQVWTPIQTRTNSVTGVSVFNLDDQFSNKSRFFRIVPKN